MKTYMRQRRAAQKAAKTADPSLTTPSHSSP